MMITCLILGINGEGTLVIFFYLFTVSALARARERKRSTDRIERREREGKEHRMRETGQTTSRSTRVNTEREREREEEGREATTAADIQGDTAVAIAGQPLHPLLLLLDSHSWCAQCISQLTLCIPATAASAFSSHKIRADRSDTSWVDCG